MISPRIPLAKEIDSIRPSRPTESSLTLQFILVYLQQWWKITVPIGLVLASISVSVVIYYFKPQYQAKATIRIDDDAPFIAFADDANSKSFVATQMQLLRHRLILEPVIGSPEIATLLEIVREDNPIKTLQGKLKVSRVGKSELYEISYTTSNADDAAKIVNEVLKSYFNSLAQMESQRTYHVLELLDQQRIERETRVKSLRDKVRTLTLSTSGQDPFAANGLINPVPLHPLNGLQSQLVSNEFDLAILEAQIETLQSFQDTHEEVDVSQLMVNEIIEGNLQIQKLKAGISEKQSKLAEILTKAAKGKEDTLFVHLSKEIDLDEKTLEQLRQDLLPPTEDDIRRSILFGRKENLDTLKLQHAGLLQMKNVLEKRYSEELDKVETFTGDTLELEIARADLYRAQQVLDLIAGRTNKLRIEQNRPARVQLLDSAKPAQSPIENLPYRQLIVAVCVSFGIPFAIMLAWEVRTRRVIDRKQLEEQSKVPVISELSSFPVRTKFFKSASKRLTKDLHIFEESVDYLRTCLALTESLEDMKILAIASATTQEGKTSVSAHLAVSLAKTTGERILLIDGDMRSPDLHTVFEVPAEPGLAEILDHKVPFSECITETWSPNLHLIPAGKLRQSPHKLLSNGVLKSFLEEASPLYRYIIIDTPPILAASESLVLAKEADKALLCVMRNVSRIEQVRSAYDRLLGAGAHPIGAVFSGVPSNSYSARYGNYDYKRA